MDIETAEAIDSLRVDVRRVESSLTKRIDRVESSLTERIDRVESSLRAEMRELHDDAKRHADIIRESLHDDIRMLAEAVVSLSERIDQRRL
jgi:hypothetical protein